MAHAAEALRQLDRNGDGKLTQDELMPGRLQGMRGARLWARNRGMDGPVGRRMGPPGFDGGRGFGPMARQGRGFGPPDVFGPPCMARRPDLDGPRLRGPRGGMGHGDGLEGPGLRDGWAGRPGTGGPEALVRPRDFGPPGFGPGAGMGMGPGRGRGPQEGDGPQFGPPRARENRPGFRGGRGPEATMRGRDFGMPRDGMGMGPRRPPVDERPDFDSPGPREDGPGFRDGR
jgi:hypothetical protein